MSTKFNTLFESYVDYIDSTTPFIAEEVWGADVRRVYEKMIGDTQISADRVSSGINSYYKFSFKMPSYKEYTLKQKIPSDSAKDYLDTFKSLIELNLSPKELIASFKVKFNQYNEASQSK